MWSRSQRWELVKEKQYWQVIATEITCSVEAVKMNAKRLGVSVVVDRGKGFYNNKMIFLKKCRVLKKG
jgi:hypothetical protein